MPPVKDRQKVRATYKMDTDTFVKHFNARHEDSLAGMKGLPKNISFDVEQSYRAFHKRLHATRVDLQHEHSPDPPEAPIEWALYCLSRQHLHGWFEIAGTVGVASCFPGDKYATRIRGKIVYHDNVKEAVARLMAGK